MLQQWFPMKITPSYQKLRGGYYTPQKIADFLASWAIQNKTDSILEPSCGDGAIVISAARRLLRLGSTVDDLANLITGIEFDNDEADKAVEGLVAIGAARDNANIHCSDFFSVCQNLLEGGIKYSAVLGNPPFIRFQNFPEEQREVAFYLMRSVGLNPNRLTNSWLPFLVSSSLLLADTGRLAMVIPAELFQVDYAAETRQFLSDFFSRITLVTFKKLLFEGVQQEVVLLLCEKDVTSTTGIRAIEFSSPDELADYLDKPLPITELIPLDHSKEKWTKYFLTSREVGLLREIRKYPGVIDIGSIAHVDVGVVTGLNDFFVLRKSMVQSSGMQTNVCRIVTKSAHLTGLSFRDDDWVQLSEEDGRAFLFYPENLPLCELSPNVQDFIQTGVDAGVHLGYKCSIRKNWYIVPSVAVPDAFMLRQVHSFPKIVLNGAHATSTDTIHRVRFKDGIDARSVAGSFMNSLTFAFSEITGRSYGGGVLTFEPSEAERLPIPFQNISAEHYEEVEELVRAGQIDKALDLNDKLLLSNGLGLSKTEIDELRGIWIKLRNRRNGRTKKKD